MGNCPRGESPGVIVLWLGGIVRGTILQAGYVQIPFESDVNCV